MQTKLRNPDYEGLDPEEAVRDFKCRIAAYERVYETLLDDDHAPSSPPPPSADGRRPRGVSLVGSVEPWRAEQPKAAAAAEAEAEVAAEVAGEAPTTTATPAPAPAPALGAQGGAVRPKGMSRSDSRGQRDWSHRNLSWIKLIDCGRQVVVNRIYGFLQVRVVQFVMSLNTSPKTIYLTRHGQSEYNVMKKIGGNSGLSAKGRAYAQVFGAYCNQCICVDPTAAASTGENGSGTDPSRESHPDQSMRTRLWTSSLQRTKQTAQYHLRNIIITIATLG
jgi:hypothetical protein